MKILITTEFYLPFICGVTIAVQNEVRILKEKGHDVRILTVSNEKNSVYKDSVYYIKQNFPQLYKDSYASIAINDPLVDEICEWAPDIIHAQSEFFTMMFAKRIARRCNLPLIFTCHTDYPAYGIHFTKSQRVWNWLTSTWIPRLINPVNVVLCSSPKIENLLLQYNVKNPILGIRLGFELNEFNRELSDVERLKLREKYGIKSDDVVFISVCRLSKEKSVDISIDIFSAIHKMHSNSIFVIVGDGEEKTELENLVKRKQLSDSVFFAGSVHHSEVWKYYKLGDLFLNASVSETQGLTFLESIASGVPVICRKDPVTSNFLKLGINGFFYFTPEECVELCDQLITNKEMLLTMRNSCRNTVKPFSIETFGSNLERLFAIALEEKWLIDKPIPENSVAIKEFGMDNDIE